MDGECKPNEHAFVQIIRTDCPKVATLYCQKCGKTKEIKPGG